MKVELLVPCFIDQFNPQTGFNMVKVLEKAGCQVFYNPEQTCCGQPAFHAGHWEDAREIGEKLLNEISIDKTLVCGAASCTGMIRNSYDLLFQNSSYHNKYRQLQKKNFELSEFLVDVLHVTDLGATLAGKAVYFGTCQASNHCKISEQPVRLLNNVSGLELVEMKDPDSCCGFGGIFSVNYPELSVNMGNEKLDSILQTGAEFIVSVDYGCLMHLDAIIKKRSLPLKVMHIADVLASGW